VDAAAPPGGDGSSTAPFNLIQAGIDAAIDGDTVLVLAGTYTGVGNKNLDFGGRAITVCSESGPDECVIDCEDDGRGFLFQSGETADAILDGVTISNGHADYGGGVRCVDSSPTFRNCTLSDNWARQSGGGLLSSGGAPQLVGCVFAGNVTLRYGAGMCISRGDVRLVDCTFDGNLAGGESSCGGAICILESSVTLTNCLLTGNAASGTDVGERGGGIYIETSRVELVDCTITESQADYIGGGIACSWFSRTTLINCMFSHNVADI
jgi:hypothetical protein